MRRLFSTLGSQQDIEAAGREFRDFREMLRDISNGRQYEIRNMIHVCKYTKIKWEKKLFRLFK